MKSLVYGIYILDVVQSAFVTEMAFRTFVISFGNVQIFSQVDTAWVSVPILNAIGELSRTEHEWLISNIPPRYILCPRILCTSDQNIGTIKESGGSNYCCKSSKEVYHI